MRMLCASAVLAAGMLGLVETASAAESHGYLVCRDYAQTASDIWSKDAIRRAGDFENPGPGDIVVISYGRKYFMPKRQPDDVNAQIQSIGERITNSAQVYQEELARCMRSGVTLR